MCQLQRHEKVWGKRLKEASLCAAKMYDASLYVSECAFSTCKLCNITQPETTVESCSDEVSEMFGHFLLWSDSTTMCANLVLQIKLQKPKTHLQPDFLTLKAIYAHNLGQHNIRYDSEYVLNDHMLCEWSDIMSEQMDSWSDIC